MRTRSWAWGALVLAAGLSGCSPSPVEPAAARPIVYFEPQASLPNVSASPDSPTASRGASNAALFSGVVRPAGFLAAP